MALNSNFLFWKSGNSSDALTGTISCLRCNDSNVGESTYVTSRYFDILYIFGNTLSIIWMLVTFFLSRNRSKHHWRRNDVSKKHLALALPKTFLGHVYRSIFVLILSISWSLCEGEALIRWVYSDIDQSQLIVVTPVTSFVSTTAALIFYEYLESISAHHLCLLMPLVLWIMQLGFDISRLQQLIFVEGAAASAVAPSVCIINIILLLFLILVDATTIVVWTFVDRHKQIVDLNPDREENLSTLKIKSSKNKKDKNKSGKAKKSCLKSCGTSQDRGSSSPGTSSDNSVRFIPTLGDDEEENEGELHKLPGEEYLRYRHNESSFLSRCVFGWYVQVLRRGWKRPLEYKDLGRIPAEESSRFQGEKFCRSFDCVKKSSSLGSVSLWRVFFHAYWRPLSLGGVLKLFGDAVNVVGPLSISPIVNYVRSIQEGNWKLEGIFINQVYYVGWMEFAMNGWILAWVALLASILQSTLSQASSHILASEGIHVKTALQARIYEKTLKMAVSNGKDAAGQDNYSAIETDDKNKQALDAARLVNLTSEDTDNIMSFFMHCHYTWAIPLKMAAIVWLLWMQLGISAVYAAIIAVLFLIPFQFLLAKFIAAVNKKLVEACDERLRTTHEVLSFIRTVKVCVWECIFLKKVTDARKKELDLLLKDALLRALITFLTQASGIMIILLAFGFYAHLEESPPDEGTLFSSLALFSQLTVPLFILPLIVSYTIKAKRSATRLQKLFSEPEVVSPRGPNTFDVIGLNNEEEINSKRWIIKGVLKAKQSSSESGGAKPNTKPLIGTEPNVTGDVENSLESNEDRNSALIMVQSGNFCFVNNKKTVLENISTAIPKGELTIVIGSVGAGKSSFLLALLGEIPMTAGELQWNGGSSVAYVSQSPWLLNCTLRENILLGKGFQIRRYRRVLKVCALQPDIDILPDGDETEIGEQGFNLSGGQRQRLAIARALYSEVPVIIMDCPFSALDTTVANQIFQEGILESQLKRGKRTIIMATQRPSFCQFANKIIYLEDKSIKYQGTPGEIRVQNPLLWKQWITSAKTSSEPSDKTDAVVIKEKNSLRLQLSNSSFNHSRSQRSLLNSLYENFEDNFMKTIPRRKLTHPRTSPLPILLPVDEIDTLQTTVFRGRRRKSQPPKSSIFRTLSTNSTLHLTKEEDEGENLLLDRRWAKSLPPRPRRSRNMSSDGQGRGVKREESIFRKIWDAASLTKVGGFLSKEGNPHEELGSMDDLELAMEDVDSDMEVYEAIVDEEERERGRISKWNYVAYLKACSWALGLLYIFCSFANQGVAITLDVWLGHWSTVSVEMRNYNECIKANLDFIKNNDNKLYNNPFGLTTEDAFDNGTSTCTGNDTDIDGHLQVFAFLSGLAVFVGLLTICLAQVAAHRGRRKLHEEMLISVVRSRVKFFEMTTLGRIINRFSSDTALIDKDLGWSIMHLVFFALLCSSAIIVNIIISPIFIIVTIPICLAYYLVQHIFRCSSRELKRLESLLRSPMFGLISETASSPVAIRAYGIQNRFISCYFQILDSYLSSFTLLHAGNRWLGISLDYMGGIIVYLSTIACLMGSTMGIGNFLTPSTVGLAIKYTLTIPVYLNWLVRFLSDTEMCLNSVERVRQYTRLPPEEEPTDAKPCSKIGCKCITPQRKKIPLKSQKKPRNFTVLRTSSCQKEGWCLEFDKVSLFYDRTKNPVVSDVSFKIPSCQKVGVCGRTGSGKSSLLMGILRMVDCREGNIYLNGVETKSISLHHLRTQLSAVLQELNIFRGSVRFNMDPDGIYNDEMLWDALEAVRLKDFVGTLPRKLDNEIGVGVLALSAGQMQLLALSRVILKKSSLVLLDEVAANLDPETEKNLLSMLRLKLPKSTIVSVSHSIKNLMESDRILVMDEGKLVEDGTPQELSNINGGVFASLLQSANNCSLDS